MTIRDLIKGSLRLIGAVAAGETPSSSEMSDGLAALNELLDGWSAEGNIIYAKVREELSLSSGNATRTIGTGGNFNTSRPIEVLNATSLVNSIEMPIRILNNDQWAEITNKDQTGNYPTDIYLDGTFPLDTINFYPVPDQSSTFVLYSLKPFSTLTNLSADFEMPPGYQEAVRYNLAVKISPEYGKPIDPSIVAIANESLARIKRKNDEPRFMSSDPFGPGRNYDINRGPI